MVSGRQIRAARALLDMKQSELAERAELTTQAINRIEDGSVQPREGTIADITRVFHEHGIEFTDNQGVRLKPSGIDIYDGPDRFDAFYDFLYEHLKRNGGDVCLNIYDEALLAKYRKDPSIHRNRMQELAARGAVTFRILTTKSDFVSHGYAKFRWQPQEQTAPTAFYAFGDCLALITFVNAHPPYVVVIQSAPLAEAYRQSFNVKWKESPEQPPNKEKKP